jgi:hypothetical protein
MVSVSSSPCAVRLAKFAFDFSEEIPASLAKFGFRENFAPEVLELNIRLASAVRFQFRSGVLRPAFARMRLEFTRRQVC